MPMMQGASAAMKKVKRVSKETALATTYKLDAGLPVDLRKWTSNKTARSQGGIPYEPPEPVPVSSSRQYTPLASDREGLMLEASTDEERDMLSSIFNDSKINLAQKEAIARSMLTGNYEGGVQNRGMSNNGRPGSNLGSPQHGNTSSSGLIGDGHGQGSPNDHFVKHVFEADLIKGTANVNRDRMKSEAFLSASGKQAPIFLADKRMVMLLEREKNIKRVKAPGRENLRQFTWAGKYVEEKHKAVYVGSAERDINRVLEAKFVKEKKKMWEHSRNLHIQRIRAEKSVSSATIDKQKSDKEMDALTRLERRRYVDEFRGKLKEHLVKTKDPLIGTIMRYVNSKVAWDILQAYKGYTMSMKAVVGLVGQTLGDMEIDEDSLYESDNNLLDGGDFSLVHLQKPSTTPVDVPLADLVNSVTRTNRDTDQNSLLMDSNFDGENVYLTSIPVEVEDEARAAAYDNNDRDDDLLAPVLITPRPAVMEQHFRTDASLDDSTLGSFDQVSNPQVLGDLHEVTKPRSAGKSLARGNLFAPGGIAKKAPTLLPHNADLATYRLGSMHSTRGTTPGSPNNMRGAVGGLERTGVKLEEKGGVFPDLPQWNSDEINPIDPLDKIQVNSSTGEIINVNAWHSNSGSRSNTPSASGIKGWNANTPVSRKMAGGFVVAVEDGRDIKYGKTMSLNKVIGFPSSDVDHHQQQQQQQLHASHSMENTSSTDMMGYSSYVRDLEGSDGAALLRSGSKQPSNTYSVDGSMSDSIVLNEEQQTKLFHESGKLMNAIESEKIALGTIPRMQPERAISEDHLLALGTGKISIDAIATQMRWAKEKRMRQVSAANSPSEKPRTSNTMGELNALTGDLGPEGGIGIQMNQFTNLDVAMGFMPEDSSGAQGASSKNKNHSRVDIVTKAEDSMFSLENPNELKRLADANTKAPPKQLKSLARPRLPVSPFKTHEEKTRITNCGVASGMGLAVILTEEMRAAKIQNWGPRVRSSDGRFRTGGSSDLVTGGFSPNKESIEKRRRTARTALP